MALIAPFAAGFPSHSFHEPFHARGVLSALRVKVSLSGTLPLAGSPGEDAVAAFGRTVIAGGRHSRTGCPAMPQQDSPGAGGLPGVAARCSPIRLHGEAQNAGSAARAAVLPRRPLPPVAGMGSRPAALRSPRSGPAFVGAGRLTRLGHTSSRWGRRPDFI